MHTHLLSEHCRAWRDLDGLPAEEMHRFEHVEADLGLLQLNHWHGRDGGLRRGRRTEL